MSIHLPKITVYITNYNYCNYIKQSIESVLNQTHQDFELFIIDDGSTDDSKQIIETYRNHPKIQIIYQQNKGLNVTNNIAMRLARGAYLMRLDADDYLDPNALELLAQKLDNNEELGLVFPNYYYVDKQGNKIGEEIRHDFEKDVSLFDLPAHGACTMIKLKFLKDLGGYNENFSCQDGYDLWIKFISHYKVLNLSQPLFSYRQHGANLTRNEERILNTRQLIKKTFVDSFSIEIPTTVAIIPVRSTYFGNENLPLTQINGKSLLEQKINTLLETKNINWIVIASSEREILSLIQQKFQSEKRVMAIERTEESARFNVDLNETYKLVLENLNSIEIKPKAIMSVSIEFPFVESEIFDDAINTLSIFKADSLIGVRPDNRMFYQHKGSGMHTILDQEKFTKLEREALYRGAGGISLSTINNFERRGKLVDGKVSHIVINEKSSFGIFSLFDFEIFKKLINDRS